MLKTHLLATLAWTSLVTCTALGAYAAPTGSPPAQAGTPPEITALVVRVVERNHWAGEEAYDAERGAQIAKAAKAARCSSLDEDVQKARKRLSNKPEVLHALDEAESENF